MNLNPYLVLFFVILSGCGKKPAPDCSREQAIDRINANNYVVLKSRGHGMFSILDDVLSLLYAYEQGEIKGVKIDFEDTGLYYDSKRGPNWFSYYFEPVEIGDKQAPVMDATCLPYTSDEKIKKMGIYAIKHIEFNKISPQQINSLIKKYIKIKPEIESAVSDFVAKNFGTNNIGIHYRGTDKISEAVRTPYEEVSKAVDTYLTDKKIQNYSLFVATDEQNFINYINGKYSKVHYQNALRSTSDKPVHFDNTDPYRAGKEALIDALLLSKTNFLIRTSSNLSRWSTYFNPDLEVFELSTRY